MDNELYHYGILGMKWGVRRYQNPDGTRTSAGKARYGKYFDQTVKRGKDKPNISPAEKLLKDTGDVVTKSEDLVDALSRIRARRSGNLDLSSMSDAELRAYINRMNLERQYKDIKLSETRRGFEAAKDILSVFGSVVGIAAGGAAIYSTIKGIK